MRSPVPQPPGRLPALGNTSPVWNRAWLAVAQAAEIPDNSPVQVLVAAEAWVVTRMDGILTAFEDWCPHRFSPLSAGSVTRAEDGSPRLTCAVHGWRFDPTGQCDLMPDGGRPGWLGMPGRVIPRLGPHWHHDGRDHHRRHGGQRGGMRNRAPDAVMLVPAHGITERYGLIWLCVGQPLAPLPEFPECDDDGTDLAHCAPVRVRASAGQVIDSFLDAAAGTVTADAVATDGWRVTGVTESPYSERGGSEHDGDAAGRCRSVTTAGPSATAHLRLELPHATIGVLVTAQPEERGTTRVFKLVTRDDLGGDPALVARLAADEDRVLAGHLALLERHATASLPLDVEPPAPGGQLNLAWRRLMARAAGA